MTHGEHDSTTRALPWRLSYWSGWCTDHSDEHPELATLAGLLLDAKGEILEGRRR